MCKSSYAIYFILYIFLFSEKFPNNWLILLKEVPAKDVEDAVSIYTQRTFYVHQLYLTL